MPHGVGIFYYRERLSISTWSAVILASPFLFPSIILCIVALYALHRARPEDVPRVLSTFGYSFGRLASRIPTHREVHPDAPDDVEEIR